MESIKKGFSYYSYSTKFLAITVTVAFVVVVVIVTAAVRGVAAHPSVTITLHPKNTPIRVTELILIQKTVAVFAVSL